MSSILTYLGGILSGVIVTLIVQYINRAKLIIRIEPYVISNVGWDEGDQYLFTSLNLTVSNLGRTPTEILNYKIELKNGSKTLLINEDKQFSKKLHIKGKSTENDILRMESILSTHKKYFKDSALMRINAYTMEDKVFKSKWIETKGLLEYFKL